MEDKKITEMFLNREEKAISELLEKYGRLFRNLAYNLVGNEEDAEECVNDACMEIWNAIPPANPDILLAFCCR
jgi:RNA polymerase sigma-70 factor (ECF subfamily)